MGRQRFGHFPLREPDTDRVGMRLLRPGRVGRWKVRPTFGCVGLIAMRSTLPIPDVDAPGVYCPSPAEIRAECLVIQSEWSDAERARRAAYPGGESIRFGPCPKDDALSMNLKPADSYCGVQRTEQRVDVYPLLGIHDDSATIDRRRSVCPVHARVDDSRRRHTEQGRGIRLLGESETEARTGGEGEREHQGRRPQERGREII